MKLENDRLTIEWTNGPGQRVFQRIEAALRIVSEATGGSYMPNPVSERILGGNLMTVHPLGGCTMGADSRSGVVNHKGQVFDAGKSAAPNAVHEGLYVCDGAVVPCPLGIHPLLTITALAERAMIHMARDHGWEISDQPVQPGALEARYRPVAAKKSLFGLRAPWRRGEAARAGGN